MENLEVILSLAGTVLGLIATSLTFLIKFIKSAKAKVVAEQVVEMCNVLMPYIKKAETFVNYSGEEKKEYVMTKATQYAQENKLKFNEEFISQQIEVLIGLTKEVNTKNTSTNV